MRQLFFLTLFFLLGCSPSNPISSAAAQKPEKKDFYLNVYLKDGRIVNFSLGKAETISAFSREIDTMSDFKNSIVELKNQESMLSFPRKEIIGFEISSTPTSGRYSSY